MVMVSLSYMSALAVTTEGEPFRSAIPMAGDDLRSLMVSLLFVLTLTIS